MQNNSKNFSNKQVEKLLLDTPEDFRLSSYAFTLPEELIAQYPSPERGG